MKRSQDINSPVSIDTKSIVRIALNCTLFAINIKIFKNKIQLKFFEFLNLNATKKMNLMLTRALNSNFEKCVALLKVCRKCDAEKFFKFIQ